MPFLYLQGPMLFLYVNGTIKDEFTFDWKKGLHFIPFLLALISISKYYFVPWEEKINIAKAIIDSPKILLSINKYNIGNHFVNLPARTIILLVYSLSTLYILIDYTLKKKFNQCLNAKIIIWLYFITFIVIVCTMSYALLIYEFFINKISTRQQISNQIYNYISAVSFSLIPIMMLVFPEVLYGIPIANRKKIDLSNSKNKYLTTSDYDSNEIQFLENKNQEMVELTLLINNYLKSEKPFINPKFTVNDIANQFDVPKHHIYYCFNSIFKKKFTNLRAELRVDYAKELLLNGDLKKLSMEGIWPKSGFSSRTNFFVTFKEITGLTPLEFVQINSKK
jgi:AraC-like DNA-binding protein